MDVNTQTLIPGAAEWDAAELDSRRTLDKLEAEAALRSPLPPKARRRASGPLPLFDRPERGLFEE